MRTLVAYFDVSELSNAEFMKLHEEVMQLAKSQEAGMFSPGRPKIEMKYGVRDLPLAEVIAALDAGVDAAEEKGG